jgi:hypothetical protein
MDEKYLSLQNHYAAGAAAMPGKRGQHLIGQKK